MINPPTSETVSIMNIPTYEEVYAKLESDGTGELNPLEEYVYENEPCNEQQVIEFRKELRGLIEFIGENFKKEEV